jgi:chromosomal replication initiation ATPase DnaA
MGQYTTMSLKDIGFLVGGFDHSTIIHSKELVTSWLDNPKYYPTEYSIIKECQKILSEKYGQRNNNSIQTPIGQD